MHLTCLPQKSSVPNCVLKETALATVKELTESMGNLYECNADRLVLSGYKSGYVVIEFLISWDSGLVFSDSCSFNIDDDGEIVDCNRRDVTYTRAQSRCKLCIEKNKRTLELYISVCHVIQPF